MFNDNGRYANPRSISYSFVSRIEIMILTALLLNEGSMLVMQPCVTYSYTAHLSERVQAPQTL